jgi:glycosyltransferase involved in cell wall biosynthesis
VLGIFKELTGMDVKDKQPLHKSPLPQVSIIIPERDEKNSIRTCLDAVLAQDYPEELLSILVVDGLSTDGTREILAEYVRKYPRIQVVDSPRKVVPAGFNLAVQRTRTGIIVRVDGHTLIAPDYVRQCVMALQRSGADNVGGRMMAVSATRFGQAVACATSTPFGVGGSRFHYSEKEEWVDSVYLGAWPRQVFARIGLFDEELIRDQDDEFNYRLREQGGRILLSPAIHSEYTVRSTPYALARQYYQYGYWKVRVLQKHPRQMSPRHFAPPAFVLILILSGLCVLVPGLRPILSFLGLILPIGYLIANLAASIITAAKKSWKMFILLPIVYAIIHFSYGSGFLIGLLAFAQRWGDKIGQTPWLMEQDA